MQRYFNLQNSKAIVAREYKYDILRLLSMYMIICNHLIYHGIRHILSPDIADVGFSESLTGQVNYFLCQFLGYVCNVGSNIFFMITGFFLIRPRSFVYTLKKGTSIWITVVFYSLVIYGLFLIYRQPFELNVFIRQVTPIYSSTYWFMTMYLGLLLISPFLARMAESLTKREYQILLFILLCMNFSQEEKGYGNVFGSTLFFNIFIFLIGGYVKLHKPSKLMGCYAGWLFVIICLALTVANFINQTVFGSTPFLQIRGLANNSIPIVTSVCIFVWFYSMSFKESALGKYAVRVSPYIISVYLIHDNSFVRSVLWDEVVCPTQYVNHWCLVPYILLVSALIMFTCILVGMVRRYAGIFLAKIFSVVLT